MTDQGPPPPIFGNVTKHPMLDLIPLTGARRKMPHVDRDTDLIGELLEFHLPQPIATGIAPSAIGRDEERVRLGICHLAHMPPPASDGFDRKLGGIVIDSYTDPALIVRRIVHSIGANLPQLFVREIVCLDAFRLPFGPALSIWSSLRNKLGGRNMLPILIRSPLRWLFLGTARMLLIFRQGHR